MNPFSKFVNWYFNRSALPYWCILALDCSCIYLAGVASYYLQFGGLSLAQHFWPLTAGMMLCLVLYILSFYAFHTFRSVLRFASFIDLQRSGFAMISATVAVLLLRFIQQNTGLKEYILIPNVSGALFILVVGTMLMWVLRVIVKSCHDTVRSTENTQNVFIYGCMQGGVALAKSIRNDRTNKYKLAGFISGDQALDHSWLLGVEVFYDSDVVVKEMKEKDVRLILVSSLQTERFTNRSSLIDSLIKANIKILMMSTAEEWDGKSDLNHYQLKEVEIEDLLPREKIEVDMVAIGQTLKGKRILITGAAGSIGSEMARQVAKFQPSDLILVDQAETPIHDVRLYMARNHSDIHVETIVTSICKEARMEKIFAQYRPEYVFHAAAYKHVPMMEDNPAEAVQNNIYGTRVIADLAVKFGTKKFVMISTDKAVNPTNVMGCSKRICEIYCQSLNKAIAEGTLELETANGMKPDTEFITTRFGNVLGSNGSVIPIFKEQIKKGGPVTVTHKDIIRYFMLIPEACRLVLEAGTMGHGGEIFVFDMGKPVRISDLAQRMIDLSGAHGMEIKYTGLRDGEKLFEEILNDAEQTKPTCHPKIKVAAVREYPYELARKNEIELHELSYHADDMVIVRKMKEIVPEFKSQHSKYQILDIN